MSLRDCARNVIHRAATNCLVGFGRITPTAAHIVATAHGQLFPVTEKPAAVVPHFVIDYEKHVSAMVSNLPRDEAMSRSVGGNYEVVGEAERRLLEYIGLRPGMNVVDIGCGSGRLASQLSGDIEYLGTDVVDDLLRYAAEKSPKNFRFLRVVDLSIPLPDVTADIVCAFSVFTHLYHAESFKYMIEAHRVLRSGGILMFSFLEFAEPAHWQNFHNHRPLNEFIERSAIRVWAERLGFNPPEFIDAGSAPQGGNALGQSVAILRKP